MDDINVLVVDDSALMRKLIGTMVEQTKGLKLADTAMNGKFALEKLKKADANIDAVVLDIEMPEMNGIEFLKERKKQGIKVPVIILSSIAEKGAPVTIEALSLGASDFILKPSGSISLDIAKVQERLAELLLAYGARYKTTKGGGVFKAGGLGGLGLSGAGAGGGLLKSAVSAGAGGSGGAGAAGEAAPSSGLGAGGAVGELSGVSHKSDKGEIKKITPLRSTGKIEIVAIGISTGGPEALRIVLPALDAGLKVPFVLVQHMPAGFTLEFARTLDKICPLDVKEAEEGDQLLPGRILIAEGSKHLEVEKSPLGNRVHLIDTPPVSGHKPSVDVLFASVAMHFHNHALGVIMTGMGRDGATQLGQIYREGGLTIGQDEASSIVYGMPRIAFELGNVMEQVPLSKMGKRISEIAKSSHL